MGATRKRSFDFYVLLFFLLAAAGWLWEVLLYLISEHTFVNRGMYRGPYLPIYGIGGLLLYLLLYQYRNRPVKALFYSALLCSALEYFGSLFLEYLWHVRWWDYSGHFMNLQGRICLFGSIAFGIGGMLLLCFVLPRFETVYHRMPRSLRMALSLALLAVFILDATFAAIRPNAGRGITVAFF